MLQYKYIPNPKIGDLIGYSTVRAIVPGVITGFNKQGNIQFIELANSQIKRYKEGKQLGKYWSNPVRTVAKNYLQRVILIDPVSLSQEETNLYNYLVHNKPLP